MILTYIVIWNASRFYQTEIRVKTWMEFVEDLYKLNQQLGAPPDLIYLKEFRP